MKLRSFALTFALLPAALFAAGGNTGTTTTPSAPTVIPGGSFTSTYVISAPGSYVLGGNRSANTSIFVIEIAAPDVTLDLNGFRLTNAVAPTDFGGGINVPNPENVEIRNGSIVDPGRNGIRASYGKGVRVIDVRVVGATHAGILSTAAASQIDRCHVVDCAPNGIWATGRGSVVSNCVVSGLATTVGVTLQSSSQVVRTVVRDCDTSFHLSMGSMAVDCSAANGKIGFYLQSSVLRGVDSFNNNQGVFTAMAGNVIIGSRIMNNTANLAGNLSYTNGGGNLIQ